MIATGARPPAGPLVAGTTSDLEYSFPGEAGQIWTWGIDLPQSWIGPLVIDVVEFTEATNVTVERIVVAIPPSSIGLMLGGIPAHVITRPLAGATLAARGRPGDVLQILVEVRKIGTGPARLDGLRIRYHLEGGASYEDVLPISLRSLDATANVPPRVDSAG